MGNFGLPKKGVELNPAVLNWRASAWALIFRAVSSDSSRYPVERIRGYWPRDEDTADALRGGWLDTGDLGQMPQSVAGGFAQI